MKYRGSKVEIGAKRFRRWHTAEIFEIDIGGYWILIDIEIW
jgi:hypothetical protein